jgi:hypothetical protein
MGPAIFDFGFQIAAPHPFPPPLRGEGLPCGVGSSTPQGEGGGEFAIRNFYPIAVSLAFIYKVIKVPRY